MIWLNIKGWIYKTKIFEFIYVYLGTILTLIKHKFDVDAALKDVETKSARSKLKIKHMENRLYEREKNA